MFWRKTRVQPRARPCSVRQLVFLIKEMIFDFLIAILSKKNEKKIQSFEILQSLKISKKNEKRSKFQIFQKYFGFS